MNIGEAKAIVDGLSAEQRLAMAIITKHLCDVNLVRGYELGLEHGEMGTRVSPEVLFGILDLPGE